MNLPWSLSCRVNHRLSRNNQKKYPHILLHPLFLAQTVLVNLTKNVAEQKQSQETIINRLLPLRRCIIPKTKARITYRTNSTPISLNMSLAKVVLTMRHNLRILQILGPRNHIRQQSRERNRVITQLLTSRMVLRMDHNTVHNMAQDCCTNSLSSIRRASTDLNMLPKPDLSTQGHSIYPNNLFQICNLTLPKDRTLLPILEIHTDNSGDMETNLQHRIWPNTELNMDRPRIMPGESLLVVLWELIFPKAEEW